MKFSLRALLLASSLAAVLFAHFAFQLTTRKQLIRDIQDVGGDVTRQEAFLFSRVTGVTLPHARLGEIEGSRLKSFRHLQKLSLLDCQAQSQDGDLSLRARRIDFTIITDELLDGLGR